MKSLSEIETTVKIAKKNGAGKIILLYCVSNYPSKITDFNLTNIEILKKKFGKMIYSSYEEGLFDIFTYLKNNSSFKF